MGPAAYADIELLVGSAAHERMRIYDAVAIEAF